MFVSINLRFFFDGLKILIYGIINPFFLNLIHIGLKMALFVSF